MTEDLFNRNENQAAGQDTNSRDGYISADGATPKNSERTMRPRIRMPRPYAQNRGYNREESANRYEGYTSSYGHEEGQRQYRPRINAERQGGYQPRNNSYQPRQQQGYRSRFNNNDGENGYQSRANYQPRQQQGYRPRYNNNDMEGGYWQNQQDHQSINGYRPRYNGGMNSEGDYRPRGNSYNSYNRNNYSRGGYNQQRQGGYNQRNNYRPRTSDYDPNAKYSMKKRIEYKEVNVDPTIPLRLNKFLANAGVCSRREADDFIQAGAVTVNGTVVTELGTKVLRTDEIRFHDQPVTMEKKVYVLLNKPKDCVTTSDDPQQRKTVMDLVKDAGPERIYPVGRLDRNTTGVLLLTNDGDLASKLTHPKFLKKKIYHVFLDKNVTAHDMQQIATGITLEDGEIHADAIEYANDKDKSQVGIEIHSGKNRIVRRIFESLGYKVVKLDRVLFAGLTKKNLRRGDWRFLTEKEVDILRMGAFE